jgi:predicted nucleic acid-binding Zn ribbon protein
VCGKGPVQRLISSPAIQFKGSGWYITDYAKKGGGDSAAKSKEGATGESKTDGGTKADSATKTETSSKKDTSTPPAATSKE